MTLFELSADMKALDDILAENGGDLSSPQSEEILSQWENELENDLSQKVDGYCRLIRELESRAKARADEAARLMERSTIDESLGRRLRERLRLVWEARRLPAIETASFRVSLARNGGKAPLDVHGIVPPEFTKSKTVVEPDKERIREALDRGETLDFASFMDRGTRISIR